MSIMASYFPFDFKKRLTVFPDGYGRKQINGLLKIIKLLRRLANALRYNPKHHL